MPILSETSSVLTAADWRTPRTSTADTAASASSAGRSIEAPAAKRVPPPGTMLATSVEWRIASGSTMPKSPSRLWR